MSLRSFVVLSLLLTMSSLGGAGRPPKADPFRDLIQSIADHIPAAGSETYVVPTEDQLRDWARIFGYFRMRSLDSCNLLLARYDYMLTQLKDPVTGSVYDIIMEKFPVRRGWGTFVFNRRHMKRLDIEVNHPLDDPDVLGICVDLFRKTQAEWLMIGGTSRRALSSSLSADVGLVRRSVYQRWHEMLTDVVHIGISAHAYNRKYYESPISEADLVVSNGRTSDQQWGISQISLAFRDTMRAAGFSCGLAMYDSGYSRLAGGWNPQGVFSNDSVGFGHWLYIELSDGIREHPAALSRFLAAADHALELSGKKIAQQVNRAFGLVSPRVVRVDSLHRMFFPPAGGDNYRIISFSADRQNADTLNVRMGRWIDMFGNYRSGSSIARLDTGDDVAREFARLERSGRRATVARIVDVPERRTRPSVRTGSNVQPDSAENSDDDDEAEEPLQVHRIPLQPVLAQTYSTDHEPIKTPFRWEGVIEKGFTASVPAFQMGGLQARTDAFDALPKFLIPIINSSYRSSESGFIGVQMTNILVHEIARLVSESQPNSPRIGLMAEEAPKGEYFLRLFPAAGKPDNAAKTGR